MLKGLFKETETRMEKAVEVLKKELASLRAGRANPSLLENIKVSYYGVDTPLIQLANISAPEPRLLVIQPWDKNVIQDIEKAIQKSDLGLTPSNDGSIIRINIPELTEERRQELVRVVRKKAEEAKVAVRNIRREVNDKIKALEKEGEISEDDAHRDQKKVQELTDKYIETLSKVMEAKEKEIMEF